MGNIQKLPFCCCVFELSEQNQKLKKLQKQYEKKYKNTIFSQICLNFILELHRNNINLDHNFQISFLKQSLLQSVVYEQQAINNISEIVEKKKPTSKTISQKQDHFPQNSEIKLPQRLSTLSEQQKKQLVKELITKSYIFMDISDIFDQQECQVYEKHIQYKILERPQTENFDKSVDGLVLSLGKFDTLTIYKLQTYVKMCEQIKIMFDNISQTVFSKFLLYLKSKLIQQYREISNKNIDQFFQNIRIAITILQETVDIMFDLHIHQYENFNNQEMISEIINSTIQTKYYGSQQQTSIHIHFLNETNLYTLVSCILFDDINFHEFIIQAVIEKFQSKLLQYKQQPVITDNHIINVVLNDDAKICIYTNPVLELFNTKHENINYFQQTIKIFNKLHQKLQPVLKLKLLAQLEKQFIKEMEKLCTLKNIQKVYDRNLSQSMADWLLNRDKHVGEKNIASIILSYSFVHQTYRLGAKGSAALSFIQNVEKILDWEIPTN